MEYISQALFWVANSLLIPDVILLLLLFLRALMLVGETYNMYMVKRRNDRTFDLLIRQGQLAELQAALPKRDNGMFVAYLRNLLNTPPSDDYADFLLNRFDNEAEKDLTLSRLMAKLGPVLGLIGTLVAMSPALVGLATGDIAGMAYNMQVVFATTVVGLVASSVGLVSLQLKKRWYDKQANDLDYVSRLLSAPSNPQSHEEEK